jgi:hypothetical protein
LADFVRCAQLENREIFASAKENTLVIFSFIKRKISSYVTLHHSKIFKRKRNIALNFFQFQQTLFLDENRCKPWKRNYLSKLSGRILIYTGAS